VTQVESSDLYVESTEFLDAWFASELESFTSAVASYFLDKTYFYSHYREGEQETDMMACGWYSDLMDTQAKLLKICDALCIDRERLIKLFRLLQRWEQAHPKTSFPLRCHLEAIKRYLIEKPFWKIIAEINAKAPDGSQEAMLRQAKEALGKLTLEELVSYDQIFHVYHYAADRQYLWAASAALGASCSDDSFKDFRSWLISRGKQVYMDALRDPQSLSKVIRKEEKLNFEVFAYAATDVYTEKIKAQGKTVRFGEFPLSDASSAQPMDKEQEEAILAEIPHREDIQEGWSVNDFPQLFPALYQNADDEAAKALWTVVGPEKLIRGHVCDDTGITVYVFENSPENIANFIGSRPMANWIIVTDLLDQGLVTTYGWFIDHCPDKALLGKITSVLVPIQMGEAEAKPVLCVTEDALNDYVERTEHENGD